MGREKISRGGEEKHARIPWVNKPFHCCPIYLNYAGVHHTKQSLKLHA